MKKKIIIEEAISDLILDKKIKEKQLKKLNENNKLDYIDSSIKGRTKSFNSNIPIHLEGELVNMGFFSHPDYIVQRFSLYNEREISKDIKSRLLK